MDSYIALLLYGKCLRSYGTIVSLPIYREYTLDWVQHIKICFSLAFTSSKWFYSSKLIWIACHLCKCERYRIFHFREFSTGFHQFLYWYMFLCVCVGASYSCLLSLKFMHNGLFHGEMFLSVFHWSKMVYPKIFERQPSVWLVNHKEKSVNKNKNCWTFWAE